MFCSAALRRALTETAYHMCYMHVDFAQVFDKNTTGIKGRVVLQGNMDPGVLFGSQETIAQRVVDTVRSAQGTRHIMNLGHGVLVGTPEDSVAHFFEVGKTVNERL